MKEIPEKLDGYTLVKLISTGGMAKIYEGRRDSIKGVSPKVAIKIMDPKQASNDTFRKLFIHEALVTSNLRHKNLIHIQDFNECEGYHYIVMEYVDGLTLNDVIRRCRRNKIILPATLVAEIGRQICEGLHYAHKARTSEGKEIGLVHRDIKPSNIMLDKAGVVKVVDFGVSLGEQMHDLKPGVRGTMGYMSIEQAKGDKVTPQSDLFSAGLLLYELCTLKRFFPDQKSSLKTGIQQEYLEERLQLLSADHFVLHEILSKSLQIDCARRFQTAKEMSESLDTQSHNMVQARQDLVALQQTLAQLPSSKRIFSGGDRSSKGQGSKTSIAVFLIVLLIPMVVILTLYVGSRVFFEQSEDVEESIVQKKNEVSSTSTVSKMKTKTETKSSTSVQIQTKSTSQVVTKTTKTKRTVNPPKKEEEKTTPKVDLDIDYALITISSDESAIVFIDGQKIKSVPLLEYKLGEGTHNIVLAKNGANKETFQVSAQKGYSYIYVWSFFDKRWLREEKSIISK